MKVMIAAVALLTAAPAMAEVVEYQATLDAKSETPPNASTGSGSLKAAFDTDSRKLSWTVDYAGLTGPATMAHFHGPAPVGKPAGVMVPITGSLSSPIAGAATLTDAQAKALTDGEMYFNIHTEANKGGEIRGQLEKVK